MFRLCFRNKIKGMKIFKTIFDWIKGIILFPSSLKKNAADLNRIEAKLNDLIQILDTFVIDPKNGVTENNEEAQLKQTELFRSEILAEINQKFDNQFLQIEALLSIYNSLKDIKYLPHTRGWAGSPDFLSKILETVLKEKPRFVLEASSGVSTVVIGLALKSNNYGNSISLDHDRFYAELTNENIELNEINKFSKVSYCPLVEYNEDMVTWKWYKSEGFNLNEKIDLLIIDGPPGNTQKLARYPAIPLLYEYFSDRTIILLDDTKRVDEKIIIKDWITFLQNRNFEVHSIHYDNFEKGMVLLEVIRL